MIKEAYEAGVKQALLDQVGSPAAKSTPPPLPPIASPSSPTMVEGNKISPAATMAPRPMGITQSSGADKGFGGTGLGKGLLNTGAGSSIGKLAAPQIPTKPIEPTKPAKPLASKNNAPAHKALSSLLESESPTLSDISSAASIRA